VTAAAFQKNKSYLTALIAFSAKTFTDEITSIKYNIKEKSLFTVL